VKVTEEETLAGEKTENILIKNIVRKQIFSDNSQKQKSKNRQSSTQPWAASNQALFVLL
jgi:hypothetical protein